MTIDQHVDLLSQHASIEWWSTAHARRMPVVLSGAHSPYSVADVVVVRNVDTAALVTAGLLRPDCNDLRVVFQTAKGTAAEIGRSVVGCNTAATDLYFRPQQPISADELLDGQSASQYWVYFSNPSAAAAPALVNTDSIDAPYTRDGVTRALWHLDEGADNTCSGGVNDVCEAGGAGMDGALKNGPTWVQGHFGAALKFVGANEQSVFFGNPPDGGLNFASGQDFTLEAWVKFDATPDGGCEASSGDGMAIIRKHPDNLFSTGYYMLRRADMSSNAPSCSLEMEANSFATDVDSSASYTLDSAWHHVAGIRASNVMRVYIDGVQRGGTASLSNALTSGNFYLGGYGKDGGSDFMDGLIDEVRVSSTARPLRHISSPGSVSLGAVQTAATVGGPLGRWGIARLDPAEYSGLQRVVLEAEVGTTPGSYALAWSAPFALPAGSRDYALGLQPGDGVFQGPTVALYDLSNLAVVSFVGVGGPADARAFVRAARLSLLQSGPVLSRTTVVNGVSLAGSTTATTYLPMPNPVIASLDTSVFSPAPAIYFEATLSNSMPGQAAFAALFPAGPGCTGMVAGSEVSTTGTAWVLVRSGPIVLPPATPVTACLRAGQGTARLANARVVAIQSSTGGVDATSSILEMVDSNWATTQAGFGAPAYATQFVRSNYSGGALSAKFVASLRAGPSTTAQARLEDLGGGFVAGSTVSTVSTEFVSVASSDIAVVLPQTPTDLATSLGVAAGAGSAELSSAALVITLSGLAGSDGGSPAFDGGPGDGGQGSDGGAVDGGAVDGGAVDGGAVDGGAVDGGAADGGAADGGAADGGPPPGGPDSGVSTTADGGDVDGGEQVPGQRRNLVVACGCQTPASAWAWLGLAGLLAMLPRWRRGGRLVGAIEGRPGRGRFRRAGSQSSGSRRRSR